MKLFYQHTHTIFSTIINWLVYSCVCTFDAVPQARWPHPVSLSGGRSLLSAGWLSPCTCSARPPSADARPQDTLTAECQKCDLNWGHCMCTLLLYCLSEWQTLVRRVPSSSMLSLKLLFRSSSSLLFTRWTCQKHYFNIKYDSTEISYSVNNLFKLLFGNTK